MLRGRSYRYRRRYAIDFETDLYHFVARIERRKGVRVEIFVRGKRDRRFTFDLLRFVDDQSEEVAFLPFLSWSFIS